MLKSRLKQGGNTTTTNEIDRLNRETISLKKKLQGIG